MLRRVKRLLAAELISLTKQAFQRSQECNYNYLTKYCLHQNTADESVDNVSARDYRQVPDSASALCKQKLFYSIVSKLLLAVTYLLTKQAQFQNMQQEASTCFAAW